MEKGKEKFVKFLKSIHIEDDMDFDDMSFLNITKSILDKNTFIYIIEKNNPWEYQILDKFINALTNITTYKYEINFVYNFKYLGDDVVKLVNDWYFTKTFSQPNFDLSVVENTLNLFFYNNSDKDSFLEKKLDLEGFLNFLSLNYKLNIQVIDNQLEDIHIAKENISTPNIEYEKENLEEASDEDNEEEDNDRDKEFFQIQEEAEIKLRDQLQENYKLMLEERRHQDLFKKGNYQTYLIGNIDENSGAVDFNGTIFEVSDPRETKTGKVVYKVGVEDESGAIYITFISNSLALSIDKLKDLKKGQNIRIKGKVDLDKFRHEVYVMCHYFYILPPNELRTDDIEGPKRVELHLHTKMSEMDGVNSIAEYCQLAKNMGHTAIAVTDHGVVQAFPEAQAAAKKYGMKILYGSELYLTDDYLHGSIFAKDIQLEKATYVCFDLETTGLSIRYDRITEFGAVKIVNGFVTERIDLLVNPDMLISKEIVEKTNITNEMVQNRPKIKELLPEILNFIGDSILVSHNIEFDYGMLNEAMINNGFGELKNPAIDTLALSKYFYSDNLYHSLGHLCERLEVDYDEEKAHRADYDAEVLSECFLALKVKLTSEKKDCNLLDIENIPVPQNLYKKRTFKSTHCTVYVKNKEGLKDLYKIISESHVKYMGNVPFTPKSLLNKYRKNLIVGSGCFNGEVFYSCTRRGMKNLIETISFYDFIEVQPLENYSFLVNIGDVPSEELIKQYVLDIINVAKTQNKLICATGDCHYCNKEDKKYRDVLIGNKSVGKINHPLNPFYRSKLPFFENPDQHFRSTKEMLECFNFIDEKDAYEYVVTNTNKIADMCDVIEPIPNKLFTPTIENCENLLKELCFNTAHELYGDKLPTLIENRLKEELNGIISNGYSVTYYIAHKLVEQAGKDGYIVGSRGSVGSSFAATMAGITEVNPLPPHYRCPSCKHVEFYEGNDITSGYDLPEKNCPICGEKMIADGQNIPFQTFLGFNAEKVPDIDLNFPADYQSTAHNYTKVLLGENNVFRAGTISTIKDKTAFAYVKDYFTKFLNVDIKNISSAKISALASGILEVKRTTGQHPGGIVVIPQKYDVYDFTPVQYPAGDTEANWKTTHFDFHSIHDTILKLDMLGHVDPQALKMMSDLTGVNCLKIPLNDKRVYSLFTTDDALNLMHKYIQKDNGASGLPEFGTNFVRQMLRETNPHSFRDLLIISGLSHGTDVWNNNAQDLINKKIVDLRGVIGCRDDIMTYLISKGLDASESFKIMESVRKGKKLTPENEEHMKEHNVPQYYIDSCNKIKYLFPKGHACAYVMMALRVGYYKIYYPLEYYATYFTLRCDQYDIESMVKGIDAIHDKLIDFSRRTASHNPELKLSNKEEEIEKTLNVALEMAERGFKFLNIDLNRSDATKFIVDKENNGLIPPFKVLDGLGEIASLSIIEARNEKTFTSKEDLLKRGKLSKTSLELLDKLGVLKGLNDTNQMSLFDFGLI